jgi:hypothetical protein
MHNITRANHPQTISRVYEGNTNRVTSTAERARARCGAPTEQTDARGPGNANPRRRLQECLAQRDGGRHSEPVEEDEDPRDVDELQLGGGGGRGALLHEAGLRGAHGEHEDGQAGHDVRGGRGGAGVVELERRVHAEDGQDEPHQVDQHVRHLLRPVVYVRRDRRVCQDCCKQIWNSIVSMPLNTYVYIYLKQQQRTAIQTKSCDLSCYPACCNKIPRET